MKADSSMPNEWLKMADHPDYSLTILDMLQYLSGYSQFLLDRSAT